MKSDEDLQINRTELLFKLGQSLIKICKYKNSKIIKDGTNKYGNKVVRLFELMNVDHILKLLDNTEDLDLFELGDTVLSILTDNTNVFSRQVEIISKIEKEVLISISPDYIKQLNVSLINVTQLPMLVPANSPNQDAKYLPYINGEISHIYNSFETIIKHKYNIKDKVENQESLIDVVKYLNNTPFSINNVMLDFILNEWNNENSSFFKGSNIFKEINKSDSQVEKNNKQSHNSKY